MLLRLGNVLYWTGCLFAGTMALWAVGLVLLAPPLTNNYPIAGLILAVGGVGYLAGRAFRYVLAAR